MFILVHLALPLAVFALLRRAGAFPGSWGAGWLALGSLAPDLDKALSLLGLCPGRGVCHTFLMAFSLFLAARSLSGSWPDALLFLLGCASHLFLDGVPPSLALFPLTRFDLSFRAVTPAYYLSILCSHLRALRWELLAAAALPPAALILKEAKG